MSSPGRNGTIFMLSLCALLLASALFGQAVATLVGTVSDPSGAVVPGAAISVTNPQTGLKRTTVSNQSGDYSIPALPPGVYTIEVELQGFQKNVIKGVQLQVDQTARYNIRLQTGSLWQTVEVRSEVALVNSETPTLGQVIDNTRVLNLPLNGRQFMDLTLQVPGVVAGNGGPQSGESSLFTRPGQNASISVSGGRAQNNSFLLDGTQNTDPDVNAHVVSPSVDSIQEFKMETHNYSAELGRSSGGQINVVTKSGTNNFHGSAYEFLRNDRVDARPFNNPGKLPAYRRNQFGATLGGPLIKDRTFFFASFEGLRRVEGQSRRLTAPTARQRNGDLGEGVSIFDPQTTRVDSSDPTGRRLIRTQFPNNTIPRDRWNPISARILNEFIPAPNLPGTASNVLDTRAARQRNNQESLRLDHRFSANDILFGRHNISNETSFLPTGFPGSGTNAKVRAQNLTLSETHIFSPSKVNEFKVGFQRLRLERLSENAFTRNVVNELGIPGVQFGGPETWGIPSVTITGVSAIGDDNFFLPMRLRNNGIQFLNNLTWMRGKHNLKFGAEVRRPQFNIIQIFTPRGDFRFGNGFTTRSAGTATGDNTGSALGSFLLGFPVQQRRTIGVNPSYLRQIVYGGYVQDDWKVTPKLTLNIGIRYDFSSPWYDKFNRLSNISFQGIPSINEIADQGLQGKYPVAIVLAGVNGTPRGLTTSDRNNFAPRFGFAWRPEMVRGFVVRGGYGLYYGATDGEHVGRISLNAPFVVSDVHDSDQFQPQIPSIGFTAAPVIGGTLRQSFIGMYEHLRTPYTHQWNLALQFAPFKQSALEMAYVGSASHKLDYRDAMNDAIPGPGAIDARRFFQTMLLPASMPGNLPAPVVSQSIPSSTLEIQTNRVNSNYHGLQTKAEKRFGTGMMVLASYTFSKTIADGNSYRRQGVQGELAQQFLYNRERTLVGYDVRRRFTMSWVWEMPFGKGKRVALSNPVVDAIAGGWQISGVFQKQSGFPFTVAMGTASANNGRTTRPDVVAGQKQYLPKDEQSVRRFFNAAAFKAPAPFTPGNAAPMLVEGPGLHSLDVAILKNFGIREGHSLQFRLEMFNSYNHPSWSAPGSSIGTAAFNTISGQSVPPRQLQFGLKYTF